MAGAHWSGSEQVNTRLARVLGHLFVATSQNLTSRLLSSNPVCQAAGQVEANSVRVSLPLPP